MVVILISMAVLLIVACATMGPNVYHGWKDVSDKKGASMNKTTWMALGGSSCSGILSLIR